jgi:hypothetical protein
MSDDMRQESQSQELAIPEAPEPDWIQERCHADPRWADLVNWIQSNLTGVAKNGYDSQIAAVWVANAAINHLREYGQFFELIALNRCDYGLYLKTEHWSGKRDEALEFWERRCSVCNSPDNLHVHHRTYERRGHEQPADLIVLCRPCHQLFHDNGRLAKPGG